MDKAPITLTRLQSLIEDALSSLDRIYNVTAEIAELRTNYSGHTYMELADKDESGNITARLKAIIWSKQSRFILPYFQSTTGSPLSEGLSVLVSGRVEYHKIYGISFIITDIDPTFTIGDIAKRRNDIINRLSSEGVIDMNKGLELPLLPESIAVISSDEAAGYGDFTDHLLNNLYGYSYRTELFRAVMQGKATSESVVSSFERIADNIGNYDLVVLIRGGGSTTDLSWFDDYNIAYIITQFPIPVITGIGHERDISVADMVAHTSCKTPTAVADFIIELSSDAERRVDYLGKNISRSAREHLDASASKLATLSSALLIKSHAYIYTGKQRVSIYSSRILSESGHFIYRSAERISTIKNLLTGSSLNYIQTLKKELKNYTGTVAHLNPVNILKRGYSITMKDGKIVKNSSGLIKGDRITNILAEGKIDSEILDISE